MTLIEVMMVVFIIGLATGLVVLTLPTRATPQQAAARSFAGALVQAQERAIVSGQPVGLRLEDGGYGLAIWRGERWQAVRGGGALADGLSLKLYPATENPPLPQAWPDLVFDPTGVSAGAEFQLRGKGARIDVILAPDGEVRLETR